MSSIGLCAAATRDGTLHLVDEGQPRPVFLTFGGTAGAFEVGIAEGVAHIDVVAGYDEADNPVVALAPVIARTVW